MTSVKKRNREKPFRDALRLEICNGNEPRYLRALVRTLFDKALQDDIQAIREIADRLDGKPAQAIEHSDVPLRSMTDEQLLAIISGGSWAPPSKPLAISAPTTE